MPGKFEKYYRIFVLLLIVVLFWSLWAQAQTTNTNSEPSITNAAPTWVAGVEHWDERRLTFGLDRIPVLREWQLLGEPLWKYVASLIFIMLALAATKLLDQIAFVWLKKFAGRTATKIDDLLLELLHGPIKVIAFVILLHIGLSIFDWSPKVKIWFSKSLILVVAISLTYLGLKTVDSFLEAWRRRVAHEADRKFNDQLFSILRKSLNIFIIIVAVLVTASNIGINITAAITSLSIGGLAIGLAAQDTLANLFGAIAVFADKPFRIGDQIKVPDAEGVVEEVGMRSTKVRSPEGHLIAVPNKAMANATIANFTKRTSIKTT